MPKKRHAVAPTSNNRNMKDGISGDFKNHTHSTAELRLLAGDLLSLDFGKSSKEARDNIHKIIIDPSHESLTADNRFLFELSAAISDRVLPRYSTLDAGHIAAIDKMIAEMED